MKQHLPIGEAAEYLGVSEQTLRRWDASGEFKASFVSPGGHRYYSVADLEKRAKGLFRIAKDWVSATKPEPPPDEFYCPTSDVFKTRLDRMSLEMSKKDALRDVAPLVVSVAGEIGNNSFDHNTGNWPDLMGAFFAFDLNKRLVVLADRGRGVLATLRNARPGLKDDREALVTAFTEILTGRAPEYRGNGLKFVRKVVGRAGFRLKFQSGDALLELGPGAADPAVTGADSPIRGCLVSLGF